MVNHDGVFWFDSQFVAQDTVEAQDGVHGRAQLVANRRNEFVFVRLCAKQRLMREL